jgi:hypothetical protein
MRDLTQLAADYTTDTPARSLAARRADTVERRDVAWLWPAWLPVGLYGELGGWPGLGKTTVTLDLLAHLTRGGRMPDGQPSPGPLNVGIAAAEDQVDTVLVPRLAAAGADLRRVHIIDGVRVTQRSENDGERMDPLQLPIDRALLADYCRSESLALVYLDALTDVLPRFESHRDADTRQALRPLAAFAREQGVTLLGVRHFAKTPLARAAHAPGGSIAFSAVARFLLQVHPDPDSSDRRVLAVAKSNLAALPGSLAFGLAAESPTATPRVEWLGPDSRSADDLLAATLANDRGNEGEGVGSSGVDGWLTGVLTDGVSDQREILDAAKAAGFVQRTVYRAANRLGVVHAVTGFGSEKRSAWRLPGAANLATVPQYCHRPEHGNDGKTMAKLEVEPAPRMERCAHSHPLDPWTRAEGVMVCGVCHPSPHRDPR